MYVLWRMPQRSTLLEPAPVMFDTKHTVFRIDDIDQEAERKRSWPVMILVVVLLLILAGVGNAYWN